MKNSIVTLSRPIIVVLAALALQACGDKPSEPAVSQPTVPAADKPSEPAVREDLVHAKATVEAINATTREITLKGEHGSSSFIAGPEVRNFDSIHVGDTVSVVYYEALLAELKQKGTASTAPTEVATASRAPVGDTPAASARRTVTGTVTIESYDTATDTVVFVNAGGERHTIAVQAQSMKELGRTLKPGDQVELTYIEVISIEVVSAQ
jgi:hypothetical protein